MLAPTQCRYVPSCELCFFVAGNPVHSSCSALLCKNVQHGKLLGGYCLECPKMEGASAWAGCMQQQLTWLEHAAAVLHPSHTA